MLIYRLQLPAVSQILCTQIPFEKQRKMKSQQKDAQLHRRDVRLMEEAELSQSIQGQDIYAIYKDHENKGMMRV